MSENINLSTIIPASIQNTRLRELMANGSSGATVPSSASGFQRRHYHRYPGRDLAYITNFLGFSVSVVDIQSAQEIDRIPINNFAFAIDINPEGDTAYITNFPLGFLTVLSIPNHTVTTVIDLNAGPLTGLGPTGVTVSPDGRYVYVANSLSSNISVINAARNEVVVEIPLTGAPYEIAITPSGFVAYVTLPASGEIAVVDLNANVQLKTIPAGVLPLGIDISPVFPIGLSANGLSNDLTPFNIQIAESGNQFIDVGLFPTDVVFHPRCTFAYATNQLSDDVSAVDVFLRREITRIPVGNAPIGIDITKGGHYLVVCNALDNTVSIIDRRTSLVTPVDVGFVPLYVKILKQC